MYPGQWLAVIGAQRDRSQVRRGSVPRVTGCRRSRQGGHAARYGDVAAPVRPSSGAGSPRGPQRGEPKLERLRQHLDEVPSEIQREQNPLLGKTFEPVVAPCAHHVLQARTVALPGLPGETTNRRTPRGRNQADVTDTAENVGPSRARRCGPIWAALPPPSPHSV
jgi:hypothetical protein